MKKLICTSLLALAVSTANAATHKPGFYLRGDIGANMFHDKDVRKAFGNMQFTGGAGIGYKFNPMVRTDLNFHYRQVNLQGQKIALYEPYLNLYYDIETTTLFTPYITAGAGITILHSKLIDEDTGAKETLVGGTFCWNVGLGSRAQLSKDVDLDLGYKFVGLAKSKYAPGFDNKLNAHQITLGLIWNI